MSPIDGYTPPIYRFGGLGTAPTVAHSDIFSASLPGALAGPGVATTAARSDALTASGALIVGEVRMYAGTGTPTGWLLCDGSAVSRTTYAALFNTISTTYGAGDGSTTFNLPSMLGRAPVGAGSAGSGLTARALGATGGEETHVLTQTEMPTHQHVTHSTGSTDLAHTHSGVGGFSEIASPNASNVNNILTDGAGSGGAHNTMPPFLAVVFIIKT